MKPTASSAVERPRASEPIGRGLLFALAVHGLLVAGLLVNLRWRTASDSGMEAELWSALPQAAAPRAQVPEPAMAPPPPPVKIKPDLRPTPAPAPPAPTAQERQAQLAIARAEEKKAAAQREERMRQEQQRQEKARAEKAREDKARLEKERLQERQKAEAKAQEKAREKAQEQVRQAALDAQKAQREAARKEQAQIQAQRSANLARIQGLAGASGSPGATGSALQSSGPSAGYAGRIKARVKPNIIYERGATNPLAEVEVRLAPDGRILSRRLIKPSTDATWNDAVLRAIDKTEVFPRDENGRVPPLMVISFQPQD